jgi:hypothetical protein
MSDDTDDLPRHFLDRWDTRAFIAIALTLSMITLTFVLALRAPESDAFKILLGAMLTVGFASAIGWYFNSSIGSEKKDVVQAKVAEKLAESAVANAGGTGTGNGQVTTSTTVPAEPATTATVTTVTETPPKEP